MFITKFKPESQSNTRLPKTKNNPSNSKLPPTQRKYQLLSLPVPIFSSFGLLESKHFGNSFGAEKCFFLTQLHIHAKPSNSASWNKGRGNFASIACQIQKIFLEVFRPSNFSEKIIILKNLDVV